MQLTALSVASQHLEFQRSVLALVRAAVDPERLVAEGLRPLMPAVFCRLGPSLHPTVVQMLVR